MTQFSFIALYQTSLLLVHTTNKFIIIGINHQFYKCDFTMIMALYEVNDLASHGQYD